MATIKSYTDINQSKKLAEILPLESADMRYSPLGDNMHPWIWTDTFIEKDAVPCWSLAALLNVLSEIKPQVYTPTLFPSEGKWTLQFVKYGHGNICEVTCDNPIDACVTIIKNLHELKML